MTRSALGLTCRPATGKMSSVMSNRPGPFYLTGVLLKLDMESGITTSGLSLSAVCDPGRNIHD